MGKYRNTIDNIRYNNNTLTGFITLEIPVETVTV